MKYVEHGGVRFCHGMGRDGREPGDAEAWELMDVEIRREFALSFLLWHKIVRWLLGVLLLSFGRGVPLQCAIVGRASLIFAFYCCNMCFVMTGLRRET